MREYIFSHVAHENGPCIYASAVITSSSVRNCYVITWEAGQRSSWTNDFLGLSMLTKASVRRLKETKTKKRLIIMPQMRLWCPWRRHFE